MAQKLQSDLLGQEVLFPLTGIQGTIRSIYIDKDDTPCYTVVVKGKLYEARAYQFKLVEIAGKEPKMKTYTDLRSEEIKQLVDNIQEATRKSALLYSRPFLVAVEEFVLSSADATKLAAVIREASAMYENEKRLTTYAVSMEKD